MDDTNKLVQRLEEDKEMLRVLETERNELHRKLNRVRLENARITMKNEAMKAKEVYLKQIHKSEIEKSRDDYETRFSRLLKDQQMRNIELELKYVTEIRDLRCQIDELQQQLNKKRSLVQEMEIEHAKTLSLRHPLTTFLCYNKEGRFISVLCESEERVLSETRTQLTLEDYIILVEKELNRLPEECNIEISLKCHSPPEYRIVPLFESASIELLKVTRYLRKRFDLQPAPKDRRHFNFAYSIGTRSKPQDFKGTTSVPMVFTRTAGAQAWSPSDNVLSFDFALEWKHDSENILGKGFSRMRRGGETNTGQGKENKEGARLSEEEGDPQFSGLYSVPELITDFSGSSTPENFDDKKKRLWTDDEEAPKSRPFRTSTTVPSALPVVLRKPNLDVSHVQTPPSLQQAISAFRTVSITGGSREVSEDFRAFEDSCLAEELCYRIKKELTRPIIAAKRIGIKGGNIRVLGNELLFPRDSLYKDATVALTVKPRNDADTPDGLQAVSAALKCSTSGVKFRISLVKVAIHFSVKASSLVVMRKESFQSQWEEIMVKTSVQGEYVTFQVDHFCWYKIFSRVNFWSTPAKVLLHNFLYFNKDTTSICGLTCIRDPAAKAACIRAMVKAGYGQPVMPLPDDIELDSDEQMSYRLVCEHPAQSHIRPADAVYFTGATFARRIKEVKTFCLVPTPLTDVVRLHYTLNRPGEDPKVSLLPLKWNPNEEGTRRAFADPTAFVENVGVQGANGDVYHAHLRDAAVYRFDPQRRKGRVLIINNDFQGTREGSEVDVRNMEELWKGLGFDRALTLRNLTARQMLDSCRRFAEETRDVSVVTVIIMSHGGEDENGKEFFEGEDGAWVRVEDIIMLFTSNECPHLQGVPKLFIFQACRGEEQDFIAENVDAERENEQLVPQGRNVIVEQQPAPPNAPPQRSDMLITFPTQPGYTAIRHRIRGSWLMNAITNVFMTHAHKEHVLDMMTMVNGAVAKKISEERWIQISNQQNYLTKKLFLFPGWPIR